MLRFYQLVAKLVFLPLGSEQVVCSGFVRTFLLKMAGNDVDMSGDTELK